ncbi:MAG: YeeE/YedE family protein [Pseudomonadota bacterium]|nr:YeeE/YedE family protein [Pseudomonadota bacterium]
MSPDFTPWLSTAGGALIGASASAMLLLEGRVAGISGIVGGLFTPKAGDIGWRLAFVAGLVLAGIGGMVLAPQSLAVEVHRAPWMLVVAGLLVGVGTRLGNGCTSGHGVCGLSRMSPRSLASVVTFMAVGAAVAVAVGQLTGGAS